MGKFHWLTKYEDKKSEENTNTKWYALRVDFVRSSNWDKYWTENEHIDSLNKIIEEKGLL